MSERFDVICAVKSRDGEKSYWTKVGVAFPSKRGGYSIFLDYVPTARNEEGRIQMLMVEPKEREDSPRGRSDSGRRAPPPKDEPMDDDIPF